MSFHLRYLVVVASVTTAAGFLVACSSPQARTSPSATSTSSAQPVSPAPTVGLLPAPPGITDRLLLRRTQVTAGTPIHGVLVVTYRGHVAINLNRGCRPQFAVAITNHRIPLNVAFPTVCSARPFIIKPGVNRLRFTVITTYNQCTQDANQATSTTPACMHGLQLMPPLPAGRYEAVLVGDALPLPAPAPVPVVLAPPT